MSTVGRSAGQAAVAVLSAAVAALTGYLAVAALDEPDRNPVPSIDLDRLPAPDRRSVEVPPADEGSGATVLPPPTLPPVTTMPPAPPSTSPPIPPPSAPPAAPPVPSPPPPPPTGDDDDDDDGGGDDHDDD